MYSGIGVAPQLSKVVEILIIGKGKKVVDASLALGCIVDKRVLIL